ncbi:MAG: DUF4170 domain-containing protein [Alphaproteobacteria bacterium]
MADMFWVVGGEYADTSFTKIVGNGQETREGPFGDIAEARTVWKGLSMASVDNAHVRYRIEREGAEAFWVIGGTYTDTDFATIAAGLSEERLGPYDSRKEAMDVWRGKAWASVDDGFVRYRIEET